ncbi:MAG: DegV family protein [Christensenellales bacterium]
MNYKIVADSGCDVTLELKKELGVEIVPLSMILGNKTFVDNDTLDADDFLSQMHEYKGQPKSSCPSPQDFIDRCSKGVINFIVTLSSKLSGSYGSANIAKGMLLEQGIESYVFDSKSASAGQLLIVKKLKELINAGIEKADIINKIEHFIDKMKTFFVLDSLENLIKNGRMSKVAGIIAEVLNIRPILKGDENGEIALFSRVRGSNNSIKKLADTIGEVYKDTKERILAITHCNAAEKAARLIEIIEEKYCFKDIVIAPTHGLTGMYANEGGIIIAF